MENHITVKQFFEKESVQKKFQELLGKKSKGYLTGLMQVVTNNSLLSKASPESIYMAAALGATLDLPINNSLGYAWIVPYGGQAQFQISWKGLVQLAKRSGQYLQINVLEVYENQFKSFNRLTENLNADFEVEGLGEPIGYVAYFKEVNGFEKLDFWKKEKVISHAKRFSKTYNSANSVWKTDFDAMAKKTVLKSILTKWATLSIELQNAIIADQSVINDVDTMDVDYVDAGSTNEEPKKPSISDSDLDKLRAENYTLEQVQTTYSLTETQILNYGS